MEINLKFSVGSEVVFMYRNFPSDGIVEEVKITIDCEDKTTPDTMKDTAEVKTICKIKPYFPCEKEYLYIKAESLFSDFNEMREYFFP